MVFPEHNSDLLVLKLTFFLALLELILDLRGVSSYILPLTDR